jgi:hypothetical protein
MDALQKWTPEEEAAFEKLMRTLDLGRMDAIRLYCRFGGNIERALAVARASVTQT